MFLQGLVVKDKLLFWFKGRSMNSQQTNNNSADDILDVIEMAIEKYTSKLRDNFIRTTVQEISSDYKYKVKINGADYNVISGCGMQFSAGESVWVHIPNGDYAKAYICASSTTRYIERETIVNVTEQLLANYVQMQVLQNSYLSKSEASSTYDTISSVNQKLNNYLTIASFNSAIASYVTNTVLENTLNDYALARDVTDEFSKYVTTAVLNNRLVNYVTSNILENVLNDYVLATELQQIINNSLQNYYTKDEADALFELKTTPDPEPDPDPEPSPESNTEPDNNGGGE